MGLEYYYLAVGFEVLLLGGMNNWTAHFTVVWPLIQAIVLNNFTDNLIYDADINLLEIDTIVLKHF